MSKPTVLLLPPLTHVRKEWNALSSKASLKESKAQSKEDFLQELKSGQYEGVVVIQRSNASSGSTGDFDAETVANLPKTLKYICHNGAGYDTIDTSACRDRDIRISNTPGAVDNATADIGIFLMLGALRSAYIPINNLMNHGGWDKPIGHDPEGKTLGILGMGGIGRAMAHRARAFGMKIIYHNRSRLSPDLEGDATYVSFDELLAQADILSLNLSLNANTRHIIGAPEIAKMKDGVVLVNTARGGLINEEALLEGLGSKKISSVGLDVYEGEPKVNPELLKHKHCFFLPHIGTSTVETQRDMELLVLKNVESALESGKLITEIPETKFVNGSQ